MEGAFMDPKFLEFWAELLKSAADGQRGMDEAYRWIGQGLTGSNDVAALFRRVYGLEGMSEKTPDFGEHWKLAAEAFQKSMKDYLSLIGVVPLKDHLDLVSRYEELKKKIALQQETIKHLEMMVESKWFGEERFQGGLKELIALQTEQFRDLMKRLGMLPEDPEL